MGRKRHRIVVIMWLVMLMLLIFGKCDGSGRNTQNLFKVKTKSSSTTGGGKSEFMGFLPKSRMPIPYSSPSRKHNDIGLSSSLKSP